MLKTLDNSIFSNYILYDVDSYIITFLNNDMVFKIMDFNINLDDDSFDEDDPER